MGAAEKTEDDTSSSKNGKHCCYTSPSVRGSPLAAVLALGIRPRTHAYLRYAYTMPRKYMSWPAVYTFARVDTSREKGTNGHEG
jgi:hypothetical protein